MNLRVKTLLIGSVLCFVAAVALGCHRERRDCDDLPAAEAPIDPSLMAFLSRARAAHHAADLQENELEKSLAPLLALVDGPTPGSSPRAPAEVREVLADTHARIADLESQLERFDSAYRRLETALRYVPETSYFRGHLFETEGLVAQRHSALLTKRGLAVAATAAQARALSAFETAMEIQAAVIKNTPPMQPDSSPQPSAVTSPKPE
jgi:tetratricopeptide (TPR) repeat protein